MAPRRHQSKPNENCYKAPDTGNSMAEKTAALFSPWRGLEVSQILVRYEPFKYCPMTPGKELTMRKVETDKSPKHTNCIYIISMCLSWRTHQKHLLKSIMCRPWELLHSSWHTHCWSVSTTTLRTFSPQNLSASACSFTDYQRLNSS